MRSFQEFMLSALHSENKPADFRETAIQLYDNWFRKEGTSYYILFRKNLRITNMQFAELLSLLRCHIYSEEDPHFHDPLFVSADEFKNFFTELLTDTLTIKSEYSLDDIEAVTRHYGSLVKRVVVLNPYYGSCSVYLPPPLRLRADKLCAESGYVHSLGRLIYVRNMTKATETELVTHIREHISRYPLAAKALFRIYSHEDFTKWDRPIVLEDLNEETFSEHKHVSDLSHGLDDVKIQMRKAYFKRTNIIEILRRLTEEFKSDLEIPPPGSYKKTLDAFHNEHGQNPERTFFLLNDSGIIPGSVHPSAKKYYICYDQLWYNNDPFYAFDEDKPAWVSHTTIPHSLAGALINITRPWGTRSISLMDPFGGSGTTLLEALKRPNMSGFSGDIEDLANTVANDNLLFFGKPLAEVKQLRDSLQRYLNADNLSAAIAAEPGYADFVLAKAEMDAAMRSATPDSIGLDRAENIARLSYEQRLIFYVLLRTRLRHVVELTERRTGWPNAFRRELLNLVLRFNSHIAFLKLAQTAKQTENGIRCAEGDYSKVCWLELNGAQNSRGSIRKVDATKLAKDSYDLIITDPPYGFNTREADTKLIKLYSEFISCAVGALREGGQLVICSPHFSYSGRHVPIFIQPEFVTQQVLLAARDHNKAVRAEQYSLPNELHGLKPPYYWEAPTALQRSILHFRFELDRSVGTREGIGNSQR